MEHLNHVVGLSFILYIAAEIEINAINMKSHFTNQLEFSIFAARCKKRWLFVGVAQLVRASDS